MDNGHHASHCTTSPDCPYQTDEALITGVTEYSMGIYCAVFAADFYPTFFIQIGLCILENERLILQRFHLKPQVIS